MVALLLAWKGREANIPTFLKTYVKSISGCLLDEVEKEKLKGCSIQKLKREYNSETRINLLYKTQGEIREKIANTVAKKDLDIYKDSLSVLHELVLFYVEVTTNNVPNNSFRDFTKIFKKEIFSGNSKKSVAE